MSKQKYKIPKTIGACADALITLKAQRSEVQKQADAIEAQEKAIEAHLIDTLPADGAEGVLGKLAMVKIVTKTIHNVEDWAEYWAYLVKHKAYDLVQRRPSEQAIVARLENGKIVPGIKAFVVKKVSVTKR